MHPQPQPMDPGMVTQTLEVGCLLLWQTYLLGMDPPDRKAIETSGGLETILSSQDLVVKTDLLACSENHSGVSEPELWSELDKTPKFLE